jgi:hypothetical protein
MAGRIMLATLLAPLFAALPYFVFGFYALSWSGGGPPAQGVLVCLVLVIAAAGVGVLALAIARVNWKMKKLVPQQSLFRLPIGLAVLFFLSLGGLAALGHDWSMFAAVFVTAVVAGWLGFLAATSWLKYSYPDDEQT